METQNLLDESIGRCITFYGVDPRTIYCQHTGRPIGSLDSSELRLVFDMIGLDDSEAIADDLFVRTMNAMRPSPAWNYVKPDSMNKLRLSNPDSLLAYLLHRLAEPVRDNPNDRLLDSLETRRGIFHARVQRWSQLESLSLGSDHRDRILYLLIELDYKFNLNRIAATLPDFIDVTPESLDDFLVELTSLRDKLVEAEIRKQQRDAAADRSYRDGNSTMRGAFTSAWLAARPVDPIKAEKKTRQSLLLNLFNALENAPASVTPEAKAKAFSHLPKPKSIQTLRKGNGGVFKGAMFAKKEA